MATKRQRRKTRGQVAEGRATTQGARSAAGVDLDDEAFKKGLRRAVQAMELRSRADLQRVAIKVQNEARKLCPVHTGRLRSSIVHVMGEDGKGPYAQVGTNVSYAPHVEFGTDTSPAQPYMRPALLLAAQWWREAARGH